jgi:hypothetical protein
VVGSVGNCGSNTDDAGIDAFWQDNGSTATASISNSNLRHVSRCVNTYSAEQRTTAVLSLPSQASVVSAFLFWSTSTPTPDTTVTFSRQNSFSTSVIADSTLTSTTSYQAITEITSIIQR